MAKKFLLLTSFIFLFFFFSSPGQLRAASLYEAQLRSYSNLSEDFDSKRKKSKALRSEIDKIQSRYEKTVSLTRRLSEKARTYVDAMGRDKARIVELEEEIDSLHLQAVELKNKFWQEQEDYAHYQAEYKKINALQEKARDEIMRLMRSYNEGVHFLAELDQKRNAITSKASKIYELLLRKQKEYEKISQSIKKDEY